MIKFPHIVITFFAATGLLAIGFFLFSLTKNINIAPQTIAAVVSNAVGVNIPYVPEATSSATPSSAPLPMPPGSDLPPQPKLTNPPSVIKGIYITGWTAGSEKTMQSIIDFIKGNEINAVVIDIKDYSGYVSYAMDVSDVRTSGAENQIRIAHPNALIKELHDNGIYVIGRITDFQDPILAKAHPEWALKNKTTGGVWTDNHGLAWMDPAARPVWDYLASIAKDAFGRGFDEINFDYIRFASDGSIGNISYPYWNGKTPRAAAIADYFKFLRQTFPNDRISADLFGLATVNNDDLGIGQVIQNAYKYFDYVCPMVYPSHYASGFIGYKNPADYPYQVINYSLERGLAKLLAMGNANSTALDNISSSSPISGGQIPNTKLRPWLQDFNLGATYTSAMIRDEKKAVYDVLNTATSSKYYGGWLLWNPSNNYFTSATAGALDLK